MINRRFSEPSAPSWKLNRADFDVIRETPRPSAKNRCIASSIRETEETNAGGQAEVGGKQSRRRGGMRSSVDISVESVRRAFQYRSQYQSYFGPGASIAIFLCSVSQAEWSHVGPDFFNETQAFRIWTQSYRHPSSLKEFPSLPPKSNTVPHDSAPPCKRFRLPRCHRSWRLLLRTVIGRFAAVRSSDTQSIALGGGRK